MRTKIHTLIFFAVWLTMPLCAADIVLENQSIKAVFNEKNGVLEQLINKNSGWLYQDRAELGQSFYLHVPLPGQRYNPVIGSKQNLSDTFLEDQKITFIWKQLDSENGGALDIEFKGEVSLTDEGLVFTARIKNNSPYSIESIHWPYLGDLRVPSGAKELAQFGMRYGGMTKLMLYPKFDNQPGYFAVDYPMQTMSTPYTLFSLIDAGDQGLYVGYQDTSAEHLLQFTARLIPGYISYELWDTGVNPQSDEISGQAVHLEFAAVHFPFVNSGEAADLHPVVLKPYQGSWHHGAAYYKAWRAGWFRAPAKPAWLREVHAWQQIHLNNPEDDIRYTYKDLIEIGKDCARHNVRAIQVTGWTTGGQDEGNPSHDTDPRLGTKEDLQAAIAEIQKMGVKIVLFNKYTWADRSKAWYRQELIKYTVKDPYGDPWYHPGYAYQTPVQLAEINTHRFSPMCHLAAAWQQIAAKEFIKSLELGADGILYDENQHHGGARYCFDPSHGHHVPAHVFAGDTRLAETFHRISDRRKSDFVYAGEGQYDLEYRHYQLSYFRVDLDHVPLHRFVAPDEEMMITVAGYNDRNMINLALMNRYIISYEPRNFKGRLDEFPLTIEYGKKVDVLRKRYQNYIWDADFRHTLGAKVRVNENNIDTYTVFKNRQNGKQAVVIVNYNYNQAIEAKLELENQAGTLWSVTPEDQELKKYTGKVIIPVNSAMVILEK